MKIPISISRTIIALALFAPLSIFSQTNYMNVAEDVGIDLLHSDEGQCGQPFASGSAWADYDNDGDIDFFVTNRGGANWLYRNEGDTDEDGLPNFVDVALDCGVDAPADEGHAAVFIDYDNDGDQDLNVTNWGSNILYRNELMETGVAFFVDVSEAAGVMDDGRAITAAWGDFNLDGYLDFYLAKHRWCNQDFRSRDPLFMNNGDGTFTDVTDYLCEGSSSCLAVEGLGFSPGWVDFDNDGDPDLYLVNDDLAVVDGPNVLWRNDGPDGSGGWIFTDISEESGTDISLNGMGLGVADYDNDGWFDFAFSNKGPNYLLRNLGDGTFDDVSAEANIEREFTPEGDLSITWGTVFFDYDNDRWQDLYIVAGNINEDPHAQPNAFFRNNADGTFDDVSVESGLDDPLRGRCASIVDLDDDGYVDVFVGNYGQTALLYHNRNSMQGNENNWLVVTVEGTQSNRDGIGARLWLETADGMRQIREITSGPTYGGGDYRAAYFGLGEYTTASLRIRWPLGNEMDLGEVEANQKLHLVEGTTVSLDPATETKPEDIYLLQNYPNPFNPITTIRYQLPKSSSVKLTVFDVSGRHIKTLADNQQQAASQHEVTWDGTDGSGNQVASGVYLYRLRANDFVQTKKMLLAR